MAITETLSVGTIKKGSSFGTRIVEEGTILLGPYFHKFCQEAKSPNRPHTGAEVQKYLQQYWQQMLFNKI